MQGSFSGKSHRCTDEWGALTGQGHVVLRGHPIGALRRGRQVPPQVPRQVPRQALSQALRQGQSALALILRLGARR